MPEYKRMLELKKFKVGDLVQFVTVIRDHFRNNDVGIILYCPRYEDPKLPYSSYGYGVFWFQRRKLFSCKRKDLELV